MLKCIAIDDEPLALDLLSDNISKVPFLKLVGTCSDAFEAMKLLEENTIDLVFIDVQMPGMTGLQFIESLQNKPMVILVTAYKQFALDGYSLDVVDYLVKPVPVDRFIKACNKAKALYDLKQANKNSNISPDYFFVNVDYSMLKIRFEDLVWIEGMRDYVNLHLRNEKRPLLVRNSLTGIESLLPANQFIRIHKSYIVSVNDIHSIRKSIVTVGGEELPIGDTYKDEVNKLTGGKS